MLTAGVAIFNASAEATAARPDTISRVQPALCPGDPPADRKRENQLPVSGHERPNMLSDHLFG
jgi:hypothetical protein